MAGVPIRLSGPLAARARRAAHLFDRSLTEQIEHWTRLGQLVEAAASGAAVERLKAQSYDARLPDLVASADSTAGRRKAARLARARGGARYGLASDDPDVIVRVEADGTRTRGRLDHGRFVTTGSRR